MFAPGGKTWTAFDFADPVEACAGIAYLEEGNISNGELAMCLGVPGRVVDVQRHGDLEIVEGRVDFDGIVKQTNLSFTPDVQPGDYVIVHVGFAISKVDEESARRTLQYLREIGRIEEELSEPPAGGPA